MIRTHFRISGLLCIIGITTVASAPFFTTAPVEEFLKSTARLATAGTHALSDERMLDTAFVSARPCGYRVVRQVVSPQELDRLTFAAGVADSLRKFAGFDAGRGIVHFYSPHLTVLADESPAGLAALRKNGNGMLDRLLGSRSRLFSFANIETDWVMYPPDTVAHRMMVTCRFTRKLNGAHVIGNTAYVKISFTGNAQMCGFEIVDPDLLPVPVERMVLPSMVKQRLEQLAALKYSVKGAFNGAVNIVSITAEKAVRTYLERTVGSERQLIPGVSVFCRYRLENGASFDRFEHFLSDATFVPNLEDYMLEPVKR